MRLSVCFVLIIAVSLTKSKPILPIFNQDGNQKGPIRDLIAGVSSGVSKFIQPIGEKIHGVIGSIKIPGIGSIGGGGKGEEKSIGDGYDQTGYYPVQGGYGGGGGYGGYNGYPGGGYGGQGGYGGGQGGYGGGQGGYSGGQSGYPGRQSGYPEGQSGYPSGQGGYSGGQSGYPGGQGGYPSGQGGYPSGQSGYPGGQGGQSGYPGGLGGYPSGGYNGGQGGYPSGQGGSSSGQSGYPGGQSGYPTGQSGYPTGQSGYPNGGNQQGGYPGGQSGYPSTNNNQGGQAGYGSASSEGQQGGSTITGGGAHRTTTRRPRPDITSTIIPVTDESYDMLYGGEKLPGQNYTPLPGTIPEKGNKADYKQPPDVGNYNMDAMIEDVFFPTTDKVIKPGGYGKYKGSEESLELDIDIRSHS